MKTKAPHPKGEVLMCPKCGQTYTLTIASLRVTCNGGWRHRTVEMRLALRVVES